MCFMLCGRKKNKKLRIRIWWYIFALSALTFFFKNYCPLWHFISLKIISRRLIYDRFYLRNKICHKGQYDSHSKGSCSILHCMCIVSPTILLNVLAKRNEVFRKRFFTPQKTIVKNICVQNQSRLMMKFFNEFSHAVRHKRTEDTLLKLSMLLYRKEALKWKIFDWHNITFNICQTVAWSEGFRRYLQRV